MNPRCSGISFGLRCQALAALCRPLLRPRRSSPRLTQGRIQFPCPDRLDQRVDDRRQPLYGPSEDAGLALLELQEIPTDPDEEFGSKVQERRTGATSREDEKRRARHQVSRPRYARLTPTDE
jgi:hypothetical protein